MKIKRLIFLCFIAISGHVYSQEAGAASSKSSGSGSSGSSRQEIRQKRHFNRPTAVSTYGNGSRFRRSTYRRIIRGENDGFAARGSFFRKKKENDGFAENEYRYKPNRRKGIR
jgi:hypothetical protein